MKIMITLATVLMAYSALATPAVNDPDARAIAMIARITPTERAVLTHSIMALRFDGFVVQADAIIGGGYVPGISDLGVLAQTETDAGPGVTGVVGLIMIFLPRE